jgi:hypothetical protein
LDIHSAPITPDPLHKIFYKVNNWPSAQRDPQPIGFLLRRDRSVNPECYFGVIDYPFCIGILAQIQRETNIMRVAVFIMEASFCHKPAKKLPEVLV